MNIEKATVSPGLVLVKMDKEDGEFLADAPISKTGVVTKVGKNYDDYKFKGKVGDHVLIAKEGRVFEKDGHRYVIVNHMDVLMIW